MLRAIAYRAVTVPHLRLGLCDQPVISAGTDHLHQFTFSISGKATPCCASSRTHFVNLVCGLGVSTRRPTVEVVFMFCGIVHTVHVRDMHDVCGEVACTIPTRQPAGSNLLSSLKFASKLHLPNIACSINSCILMYWGCDMASLTDLRIHNVRSLPYWSALPCWRALTCWHALVC